MAQVIRRSPSGPEVEGIIKKVFINGVQVEPLADQLDFVGGVDVTPSTVGGEPAYEVSVTGGGGTLPPIFQYMDETPTNANVPAAGQTLIVTVDTADIGGTSVLNLPASPATGSFVTVKDLNAAGTYGITIDGNGNAVDGLSAEDISDDRHAKTFVFDGAEWYAINDFTTPYAPG